MLKPNSNKSDEWLMLQVRSENLDCMSELFERYHVALYNFFRKFRFQSAQSEDLTQQVFERMLKYRRSYRSGATFRTWMYQIARNIKADQFKQRKRFQDDFYDLTAVQDDVVDYSEQTQQQEEENQLLKAMDALNDEQRELLVLTKFQEMKYSQVAQILQCTEGAVKVKVHRAIKQLKKQFFKIRMTEE